MDIAHGHAIRTRFNVAEVADMVFRSIRSAVRFAIRIEVTTSAGAIGRAAIAGFVNMKAMLASGKTGDVIFHVNSAHILRKFDCAGDIISLSCCQLHRSGFRRRRWRRCSRLLRRLLCRSAPN